MWDYDNTRNLFEYLKSKLVTIDRVSVMLELIVRSLPKLLDLEPNKLLQADETSS